MQKATPKRVWKMQPPNPKIVEEKDSRGPREHFPVGEQAAEALT